MRTTWILTALPLVPVCALLYFLPSLRRRDQFFAVTVAPAFIASAAARRILRNYRRQVLIHSALALGGLAVILGIDAPRWMILPLVWPVAGSMFAIAGAHRAALRFATPPTGLRTASLQPRSRALPGGRLLWIVPFLILGVTAGFIALQWSEIPPRIATHWGAQGEPVAWATRRIGSVFLPLIISAVICTMNLVVMREILGGARGSPATRMLTGHILLATSYLIASISSGLALRSTLGGDKPIPSGLGIAAACMIAGVVALIVTSAKRAPFRGVTDGTTDAGAVAGGDLPQGDGSADRHWLGGMIYYNRDDPALFVEKRIGIGYDLNFGNPRSWLWLALLIVLPLAALLLSRL